MEDQVLLEEVLKLSNRKACPLCGFHFNSQASYDAHLGTKCTNFQSKRVSAQLEAYLVSQCRESLTEVVPEITQISSLEPSETKVSFKGVYVDLQNSRIC